MEKLPRSYFFKNNALHLARDLLGKYLVRDFGEGEVRKFKIIETEAYLGSEDLGNHASKGRTKRTEVMFAEGGVIYAYLIYGVHWLLNIVTGPKEHPQAVLIRGVENCIGPGRVGKLLKIDKSFNNESISNSDRIWIADGKAEGEIVTSPRVGIDYAGEVWKNKPWRFQLVSSKNKDEHF